MIINQSNIKELYVNLNTLFNMALDGTQISWDKVAMEVPSSTSDETYAWLGQLPSMREWLGDRIIQNLMLSDYTVKNKDFELTIAVKKNDIQDDRIGIYKPIVQDMAQQAKRHPDQLVFELLGKGFTNKCYDGKPFFADNHQIDDKGKVIQSNKGNKKLSTTSYGDARADMMTIKGADGKSLKIVPDLLVVPPQLEAIARKILFSDLIEGSTNIYKDTCQLLVEPELADYPNQWYLFCTSRAIKPLIFQNRQAPNLVALTNENDDSVFLRKEYLYGVDTRCNAGYGLWQLAFGSTGEVD